MVLSRMHAPPCNPQITCMHEPHPRFSPQVKLPLDVGTRVECKWEANDNQFHTVKIIERRQTPGSSDDGDYEYYVHYIGCESISRECAVYPNRSSPGGEGELALTRRRPCTSRAHAPMNADNRRMDEWVSLQQLDLATVQLEQVEEADGPGGRKKKKIADEEHDEEHADFDANALREHEEFTKVCKI